MSGQDEASAVEINAEAARLSVQALLEYAAAGLSSIQMLGSEDACPACAAVAGRVFLITAAPAIPVPGCSNEICRCDYLPVI